MRIRKCTLYRAGLFATAMLLIATSVIHAAPQSSSFVGTWQITMEGRGARGGGGGNGGDNPDGGGGGNGGGSGGGGGRGRGRGGGAQTLVIAQDGDKFTVTHTTPRSNQTFDATLSGGTMSWTETRQGRDGNSVNVDYKATVDGDTMAGTMGLNRFSRPSTAKRSN
jgi:hypothetical protein